MTFFSKLRDSGNELLDRLPNEEFAGLEPMLQRVGLDIKQVVQHFDTEISHVYFPTTALLSLLTVLEEDDPIETSTVGKEGFVGLATSLGVTLSPHRVICQKVGVSLRLPVSAFQAALARGPALTHLVQRYIAYSLRSSGQGMACNALHPLEARASRWLLTIHDQAGIDEFPMTQEFLAFMLGVRRQSVTVVAAALHAAGLIEYRRGIIVVRDRPRLEEAACECYFTLRNYYDRFVS
jgi:CRP-like cAMP-binding protein